jgi:hypothetical protein
MQRCCLLEAASKREHRQILIYAFKTLDKMKLQGTRWRRKSEI